MRKKAPVYLIPFSHLDLFWAGTREECLSRGAEIIFTALRLLEKYPDYHFMIEAVNFLDYFCSAWPDQIPALKRFLTERRLEICPARSLIYTQLPSGETLVRNYLYGDLRTAVRFFRENCNSFRYSRHNTTAAADHSKGRIHGTVPLSRLPAAYRPHSLYRTGRDRTARVCSGPLRTLPPSVR